MKLTKLFNKKTELSVLSVMGQQPDKVDGNFSCNNNRLTSLVGSPANVSGDFFCNHNKLTSLTGAPSNVSGDFLCYSNQLTSLVGSPAHVGGSFYCHSNQLTSLVGSPAHVGGSFYCDSNKLKSLAGAPAHVDGSLWADDKLPLMKLLMTSAIGSFNTNMRCADIVNLYLKGMPLTRSEMLQLQQELIDAGFEEEAQL